MVESIEDAVQRWMGKRIDEIELLEDEPQDPVNQEQEEKKRIVRRAVSTYGVPMRHAQRHALGTLEDSEALRIVNEWRTLQQPGSVLVLAGEVGSGKSQAAAHAVMSGPPRSLMGQEWPPHRHPIWIDSSDLHQIGLYDKTGREAQIIGASVLAIDDVGTEFDDRSGVMQVMLDRIVNKRYYGPGWTVITTNLSSKKFGDRYGARIMSRLHEPGCGFRFVRGQYR